MYQLTKEEYEALWRSLNASTKLICKGRLVTDKEIKEEDHDLQDESNPIEEGNNR